MSLLLHYVYISSFPGSLIFQMLKPVYIPFQTAQRIFLIVSHLIFTDLSAIAEIHFLNQIYQSIHHNSLPFPFITLNPLPGIYFARSLKFNVRYISVKTLDSFQIIIPCLQMTSTEMINGEISSWD